MSRPDGQRHPGETRARVGVSYVVSLGMHACLLLTLRCAVPPEVAADLAENAGPISLLRLSEVRPDGAFATEQAPGPQDAGQGESGALDPRVDPLATLDPSIASAVIHATDAAASHRIDGEDAVPQRATHQDAQTGRHAAERTRAPFGDEGQAVADSHRARDPLPESREPSTSAREEPVPAEEDEPPPKVAKPDRFVRTHESQEVDENPDATLVSSRSTRAEENRRAPVTSDTWGPRAPRMDGAEAASGMPRLVARQGELQPTAEEQTTDAPAHLARPSDADPGGGGLQGSAPGQGAPTAVDRHHPGGPAAPSGAGVGGQPRQPVLAGGAKARDGFRIGPRPGQDPAAWGPAWWKPMAMRVVTAQPVAAPMAIDVAPPASTEDVGVAVITRAGEDADRGATLGTADTTAPEGPPRDEVREGEGDGEARLVADPVDDLRAAMGWAPIDRSQLARMAIHPGAQGHDGLQPTSPQTVLDDPSPEGLGVNARGTDRGRYIERVDDAINSLWYTQDLDIHQKAIGIQGRVVVDIRIARSGRVRRVHITTSSGNLDIDRMALASIPSRFPRIPRDLDLTWMDHDVTLVYRNPFIASAGGTR